MFSQDGMKAPVDGIADDQFIACGCARVLRQQQVELAIFNLDDTAEPHVPPFADAPRTDRHGWVIDCSPEGFGTAMHVSLHGSPRMRRPAEPVMPDGGTSLATSVFGSARAVRHDDMTGPVKAALEDAVRHAVAERGDEGSPVHALSPGPMRTRAAAGIIDFDARLAAAAARAPTHQMAGVGTAAAFPASRDARTSPAASPTSTAVSRSPTRPQGGHHGQHL